ncbi:MAG: DUF484 family protein [Methylococcaceae bacterium]|nr:MAG: DUF484 family protein [Methylococcaceae bacterium]
MNNAAPIREADVVAYLQEHRDFFGAQPHLLEKLYIPHASGGAVSLVEKQMALMRESYSRLQRQMDELLDIARDNDKLFQRLHQFTLAMLDADDFAGALASLDHILHQCFEADFVAVRLFMGNSIDDPHVPSGIFLAPDAATPYADTLARQKPLFGALDETQRRLLFGTDADQVASCAVIPLLHSNRQGLLGIGSRNAQRYHPAMDGLVLGRLGEIVAARLAALLPADG